MLLEKVTGWYIPSSAFCDKMVSYV
jgi:hypothetical protein